MRNVPVTSDPDKRAVLTIFSAGLSMERWVVKTHLDNRRGWWERKERPCVLGAGRKVKRSCQVFPKLVRRLDWRQHCWRKHGLGFFEERHSFRTALPTRCEGLGVVHCGEIAFIRNQNSMCTSAVLCSSLSVRQGLIPWGTIEPL